MTGAPPPEEDRLRLFEEHRLAGGDAPLADFLPDASDPSYLGTLEELVAMDLEIRWKAFAESEERVVDPPSLTTYRDRYPALADASVGGRLEKEEAWLRQRFSGPAAVGPGSRVGRYLLIRRVGRGAFASVWQARDEELRREVAIKVPRVELGTDVTMLARVMREARSAGRLRHPSIVPVHEVVELDGRPCIVSEFVDGPTLSAALAERPFGPDEAATLTAQLADALAYAHENGVVHRDVKPGNVLLESSGRPVLTDFGLAQVGAADATLTQHGEILGTPAYMSPEQARGDRASVDGRSDVYSLGAVLYELLTRRRPFHDASTAALLYAVVHHEPVRPRSLDRHIPADLETICLTAMAKERGRRYASAAQLAADLRRFLDRRPIEARRPGALGRAVLWVRRRPAVAATLAVSTVLLAAVTTIAFSRVVDERDLARESLYRSLLREAEAELAAHETGWLTRARAAVGQAATIDTPARDPVELRSLVLRCELSPHPSFELTGVLREAGTGLAALSADRHGGVVVLADESGDVVVVDNEGRTHTWTEFDGRSVTSIAVHPDGGTALIATEDGALALLDLAERRVRWREDADSGNAATVVEWSDDGNRVAVGRASGGVDLFAYARDGVPAPVASIASTDGEVRCLAMSSHAERVAVGTSDERIRVWERGEGVVASRTIAHPPRAMTFDPTGRHLAVAIEQFLGATVWDTSDPLAQFGASDAVHQRDVVRIAFDERGRLATASLDGSIGLFERAGRQLAVARGDYPAIVGASFGDAGRVVVAAYLDGTVRRWRVLESEAVHVRGGNHDAVFVPGTLRLITSDRRMFDYSTGFAPSVYRSKDWSPVSLSTHVGGRALLPLLSGEIALVDPAASRLESSEWASFGGGVVCTGRADPSGPLAVAGPEGRVVVYAGEDRGRPLAQHSLGRGKVLAVAPLGATGDVVAATVLGVVLARQGAEPRWIVRADEGLPAILRPVAACRDAAVIASGDGRLLRIAADSGDVQTLLTQHDADVTALAVSRDGGLVAVGDARGQLILKPVGFDASVVKVADTPIQRVSISPSGDLVAVLVADHHVVVDVANATPVAVILWGAAVLSDWTDDGSIWGAVRGWQSIVRVPRDALREAQAAVLVDGAEPTQLRVGDDGRVFGRRIADMSWGLAVSPDGRLVATTAHFGSVGLWDAATLAPMRTLIEQGEVAWCAAFSPDSRRLAVGSGGDVVVLDVETNDERVRVADDESLVVGLDWHPGGRLLAASTLAGRVSLLDPDDGRRVASLFGATGVSVHDVAFDPSGTRLAGARDDGAVVVWPIDADALLAGAPVAASRVLERHQSAAWALAWDPGGRYLASGAERGDVILRDAPSLQTLARLLHFAPQVRALAFDDEARLLAVETYHSNAATWDLDGIRSRLRELDLDW